jgi:hypothetical protein
MPIQQVNSSHFKIIGQRSKTLSILLGGNLLVYFTTSNESDGCRQFDDIFKQLASSEKRLQYVVCDVARDVNIVRMSNETTTPIKSVPFVIIYINNMPKAFMPGSNLQKMRVFINDIIQRESVAQSPSQTPIAQTTTYTDARGPSGLYGNKPPNSKINQPEIGEPPSLKSLRGNGKTSYAPLGAVDDAEDVKLTLPGNVLPYNVPWESQYKELE